MTSINGVSVESILVLVIPLMYIGLHVLILGACVFGAMQPSLRREFIWFTLAAALSALGSAISLVPAIMRLASPEKITSNFQTMSSLYGVSNGLHVLALLLFAVGFILLALKARSLPVFRN